MPNMYYYIIKTLINLVYFFWVDVKIQLFIFFLFFDMTFEMIPVLILSTK